MGPPPWSGTPDPTHPATLTPRRSAGTLPQRPPTGVQVTDSTHFAPTGQQSTLPPYTDQLGDTPSSLIAHLTLIAPVVPQPANNKPQTKPHDSSRGRETMINVPVQRDLRDDETQWDGTHRHLTHSGDVYLTNRQDHHHDTVRHTCLGTVCCTHDTLYARRP